MLKSKEAGQGLVEYILIIALVALLVIGALKLFGKKTKEAFKKSAETIESEVDKSIAEGAK